MPINSQAKRVRCNIAVRSDAEGIFVEVSDTGAGIPP